MRLVATSNYIHSTIFTEIFVFVNLHLLDVKFNVIFDKEILMIADIFQSDKLCLLSKLYLKTLKKFVINQSGFNS